MLLLTLLWGILAPVYARFLSALAAPLLPAIESSPGTRYLVEGTQIVAERSISLAEGTYLISEDPSRQPAERGPIHRRTFLHDTGGDYPLALLAALVLATPGFSLRRRGKVLTVTLGLLTLTQFFALLAITEYSKLMPTKTAAGLIYSTDYSLVKLRVFDWLNAFCEFMGGNLVALVLYFGAIALVWDRPEGRGVGTFAGRNAPCPCGSGRKAKRCCGG